MKTALLLSLLLSITATAAERMAPGSGVRRVHPSAHFCKEWKGKNLDLLSVDGGWFSLCKIGDAEVSPMNIYYSLNVGLEKSDAAFLEHPAAQGPAARNPADYCRFVGGSPQSVKFRLKEGKMNVCTFEDNGHMSTIGLTTLFRGPAYPGNAQLVEILKNAKK